MIETKYTSAKPELDRFYHAMMGLCGLLLCLMLVGCASSERQASVAPPGQDKSRGASDRQLREDITEAVLRHMARPGTTENDLSHPINRDHKVYFLSISQWYDPSPEFLKRLNNLGAPVKPLVAGEWKGAFIHDRATGERGAAFYIERIALRSDDEADVDAVINPGGPKKSCGWFYRLQRKDGKWVVVRETWKWMS